MTSSPGHPPVLYEDNHLIALFKEAGLRTQPDTPGGDSLLERARNYLKDRDAKPGNVFLGLLHRLDRPVSGVVLFAKTSKGASRISEQIRNRTFEKIYACLVEGIPKDEEGRLVHYLSRGEDSPAVLLSDQPMPGGQRCILHYRVRSRSAGRSLVEISLETGRKHQIRAQLACIGHPIVGDRLYGARSEYRKGAIALLASRISFSHPVRSEETITVEVPPELSPLGAWRV